MARAPQKSPEAEHPKPIQVNPPTAELSRKISDLASQLHTSRGGFCLLAVEFCLPKLESGEFAMVNGKIRDMRTEAVGT